MARKILIVEDERLIAEDLCQILTHSGYEVVGISATGHEALALVETAKPELVSMDISIRGDMDGIETAHHIKRRADIPIIFISSYSDAYTIARAKEVSSFYIVKPFNDKDVVKIAAKALGETKAE